MANEEPAAVLVVDDDARLARSYGRMLGAAGFKTLVVYSFADALLLIEDEDVPIGAALVDILLDGEVGTDLVKVMLQGPRPVASICVTGRDEVELGRLALEAGALDILKKGSGEHQILEATERAVQATQRWQRGRTPERKDSFSRQARIRFVKRYADWLTEKVQLSEKQHQVLHLLLLGRRDDEIAEALGISSHTVKVHASKILKKLQLKSRAELWRLLM